MWLVANGFDITNYVPYETISTSQAAGDQLPSCTFDVVDTSSALAFDVGQEVIIFNEAAPPTKTLSGRIIPTTPAHNMVQGLNVSGSSGGAWALTGALSIFSGFPGLFPVVTFNNTPYSGGNNFQYVTAITPYGYIHVGQKYMFSLYVTIATPLAGALAYVAMQFQDAGGTLLGSPTTLTFSTTTGNAQQQVNVSATAPANAAYCQVWFGGQVTVSGTNSGTISWGSPQAEPMWFSSVSYPTPDCNNAQVNSAIMPDNTFSRACRVFAGYIDDLQIEYDSDYAAGPNRVWHVSCAGLGAVLENATVTGVYQGQYDSAIITSAFANYSKWINVTNPANSSSPNPLIQGVLVDSISFNENTLRDVLNSLTALSGFIYYLDFYGTLYYLPAYYSAAPFQLTDATPDNVTTFSYYEYKYEKDATQQKWDVVVIGGKFNGGFITDSFTGTGAQTTFSLTQQPYNIQACTVGGSSQKVGVKGRDTNGIGGIQALYDKAKKQLIFNSAPGNTVAVAITYTYEAPVVVECIDNSINKPVSPAYALPPFLSKVHDTNLTSLAAATTRGLNELTNLSKPLVTITCKSQQFASVGQIIYFTSSRDNIVNQPYVVQQVDGSYKGNGVNEFSYTLGYYRPKFTDHSRHIHKATVRSTTTAAVDVVLQTDLVIADTTAWSEVVTATPIGNTASVMIWGTGVYGQNAWNGYAPVVLSDSPLNYYRLGETSGTTANDSSGNGRNGTISATGVTLNQPALITRDPDAAMLFNGSSGVITLPTTGLPTGANPWSIEAWCKISAIPASGYHTIVGFGTLNNQQMGTLFILSNGTTAQFVLSTYAGDITSANISTNTNYHVVGTYDGTNTRLYVNGQLVAGPSAFALNIALAFAKIGSDGGDWFSGIIDEVAIYNSALSGSRILAHYQMGTV